MTNIPDISLNDREGVILQSIIQLYLLKAQPISSKLISQYLHNNMKLSPATIRNIMQKLEETQLIDHPHTSAGRIPTDKGYRYYVDSLMHLEDLNKKELDILSSNLNNLTNNEVLRDASRILGLLSQYLGLVEIPNIKDLILERIELIVLASNRLMLVLMLDSNNVRTLTIETQFELDEKHLNDLKIYINEKISGKPLSYIRSNFSNMISDFPSDDTPLIRLFVDSVEQIFQSQKNEERIIFAGTKNLLSYPEFGDPQKMKSVIEIVENEDIIIHLLDKKETNIGSTQVLIGSEMQNDALNEYSIVWSDYKIGSAMGSIGLIGPRRMNYSKMISLVNCVSDLLSS